MSKETSPRSPAGGASVKDAKEKEKNNDKDKEKDRSKRESSEHTGECVTRVVENGEKDSTASRALIEER